MMEAVLAVPVGRARGMGITEVASAVEEAQVATLGTEVEVLINMLVEAKVEQVVAAAAVGTVIRAAA
jgi:hypothetical protein